MSLNIIPVALFRNTERSSFQDPGFLLSTQDCCSYIKLTCCFDTEGVCNNNNICSGNIQCTGDELQFATCDRGIFIDNTGCYDVDTVAGVVCHNSRKYICLQ